MSSFVSFFLIYAVLALLLQLVVFVFQPDNFIDEIYHVPQAQKYCAGNFTEWDSKITTLPGLYLISVGFLYPLSNILNFDLVAFCSTQVLRSTNLLLSVGNFYLIYVIFAKLSRHQGQKNLLGALNLALFPPMFFFSSLYYTDVASVFMVLLMFSLHLHKSDGIAACAGALSILIRQTNVVWVLWVAARSCDLALREVLLHTRVERSYENIHTWREVGPSRNSNYLLITLGSVVSVCFINGGLRLAALRSNRLSKLAPILSSLLPYATTSAGFIIFVIWNNGIVVGDRSAHQASVNLPQLFYFSAFAFVFAAPHFLSTWRSVVRTLSWYKVSILLIIAICGIIVRFNTLVHPYLLSDNRHYTFYVWKLVYERLWFGRYVAIPVYVYSWICVWRYVSRVEPFLVSVAYIVCVVLSVVPQRLLEVRYFTMVFVLLRLHVPNTSRTLLTLELIQNVVINAASLVVFVTKTFTWSDMEGLQRIIW